MMNCLQNRSRNIIIFKNLLNSFLIKGVSLYISLLTTPAYIAYFCNNEILGLWFTILSVLNWILNFDLGLGNGIRNRLVKDLKLNNKEVKKTLSSSFFWLVILSVIILIIVSIIIYRVDINALLNIDEKIISEKSLSVSIYIVLFGIVIKLLLNIIVSIIYAMQKSSINDLLLLIVNISQLIIVKTIKINNAETALIVISAAYSIIINIPYIVAGFILFHNKLKGCFPNLRYYDRKRSKEVTNNGIMFFLCQVLYMIIMNSNEFIITNVYGSSYVVDYTLYLKITNLFSMIITLSLTPFWSMITKAKEENDYCWIKKILFIINMFGFVAMIIQFVIVPFEQSIFNIWLKGNSFKINIKYAVVYAFYGSALIFSSIQSTFANGLNEIKFQSLFFMFGVVFKILFIYTYLNAYDWISVIFINGCILFTYGVGQLLFNIKYLKAKELFINH